MNSENSSVDVCTYCDISLSCLGHGRNNIAFSFCAQCGQQVAVFPDGSVLGVDSVTVMCCPHGTFAGKMVSSCTRCDGER